jgi:hypothetical protein
MLEERAQLAISSGEWNPSAFPRLSRAAGPDNGELVDGTARAELKLFLRKSLMRENRETKWRLTH